MEPPTVLCLGRADPGKFPLRLLPVPLQLYKRKDCSCCTLGPRLIMPATRSFPHPPAESPGSRGTPGQLLRAHPHDALASFDLKFPGLQIQEQLKARVGKAQPDPEVVCRGKGSQRCHVRQSPSLRLMLLGALECKLPLGFNPTSRQES